MFKWLKPVEESRFKAFTNKIVNYVSNNIEYCKELYHCPKSSKNSFWKIYSMYLVDFLTKYKLIIIVSVSMIIVGILMCFFIKKKSWINSKIFISLKKNKTISEIQISTTEKADKEDVTSSGQLSNEQINDSKTDLNADDSLIVQIPTSSINNDTTQDLNENSLEIKVDNPKNIEQEEAIDLEQKKNPTENQETLQETKTDQEITIIENTIDKKCLNEDLEVKSETEYFPQNSFQKKMINQELNEFKSTTRNENNEKNISNKTVVESRVGHSTKFIHEYEKKRQNSKIPLVHEKKSQSSIKSKCRPPFRNSLIKHFQWEEIQKRGPSDIKSVKLENVQVDVKLTNQCILSNNEKRFFFDNIDNF